MDIQTHEGRRLLPISKTGLVRHSSSRAAMCIILFAGFSFGLADSWGGVDDASPEDITTLTDTAGINTITDLRTKQVKTQISSRLTH